jgi:hypothetical protein
LDNSTKLGDFLESELCSADLEKMAPYLWMMSSQSSANIRPLHHQKLLGREIIITETPKLHLVWHYDRIFIKPLPKYLLSHLFWSTYLLTNDSSVLGSGRAERVRRAALGYIRTYRYLVKHESDFDIAQEKKLIPSSVTWSQFCAFIHDFDNTIFDADVSGRYNYGELRLSRLHFYGKFILGRAKFEYLPTQYATYFSVFFGPLLFAFAATSLMLSAMQLEMTVQDTVGLGPLFVGSIYRWFSVIVVLGGLIVAIGLGGRAAWMYVDEWVYALRVRRRRLRAGRRSAEAFNVI